MMYKMIATSNALLPDERRERLEDSRRTLRAIGPYRLACDFYPEGCQLGFGFGPEGTAYLTAPLWVNYYWGSPDNKLDEIITEEKMFYERRSSIPEVVRNLWIKLFPQRKVGLYEPISL